MNHLIKSIIVAGALAFAGHQAHAEKYLVTLKATEFFPDSAQGGKIVKFIETNALILGDAAADFSLDPKALELVYDTVADQVQVVKKIDGSVVAVEFSFHDGNVITSPNGERQHRQAMLHKGTDEVAIGSVIGRIDREFDDANPKALIKFRWQATFQFSVPQTAVDEPSEIVSGMFTTGKLFTPHR